MRFWSVLLVAMALLMACGPDRSGESADRPEPSPFPPTPATAPEKPARPLEFASEDLPEDPKASIRESGSRPGSGGGAGDIPAFREASVDELDGFDGLPTVSPALPVALWVDGIEVVQAPIVQVGVEENGEMEIPGGSEVGWYKFGASPGSDGSAVLAAHVAFDGEDGVFRDLADVAPGADLVVGYDDGSTAAFEVVELEQYSKADLPFERVFARDGDPILTLITCGGAFDSSNRSFADNVVAYAVPA